jgi:NADH-quinone oxidoreductase subunit M
VGVFNFSGLIQEYNYNLLGATSVVIGSLFLWLFNRIAFGNLKTQYISKFLDASPREVLIFCPLILGTLAIGVYPNIF